MKFTADYCQAALKSIEALLKTAHPRLMAGYGNSTASTKSDNTLVTELDVWLEQQIKDCLAKYDASVGFWGEESGNQASSETFWIIDPIDGTEPFVRGYADWGTMAALVDNGKVVASLTYNYPEEELLTAIKGQGAYKNWSESIKVSQRPIERSFVDLGGVTDLDIRRDFNAYLRTQYAVGLMYYGAAVKWSRLSTGKIDGYVCHVGHGHEWDYAAGSLIAAEAGAIVKNIGKDDYSFYDRSFVAAEPVIFDKLYKFFEDL